MTKRYPTNLLEMVRAVREEYLSRNPEDPQGDFWRLFLCNIAKNDLLKRPPTSEEKALALAFQAAVLERVNQHYEGSAAPSALNRSISKGLYPDWASKELYESFGSPALSFYGELAPQLRAFVHAARMNILASIEAEMQTVADTLAILPKVRADFERRAPETTRTIWLCHLVGEMFHEGNLNGPVTPVAKMFCDVVRALLIEAQEPLGTDWSGADVAINHLSEDCPDKMPSWFDPADHADGVPRNRLYLSRLNLLTVVEQRLQARLLGVGPC